MIRVLLLDIFAIIAVTLNAAIIHGKVYDQNDDPLTGAVVTALRTDSTFIGACTADDSGIFSFDDSGNTAALVRVEFTGYTPVIKLVSLSADMGTIVLSPSLVLSEVTVTSRKPVSTLKGNAVETTVAGSYLSTLGTAYDVLPHIPLVTGRDGDFKVFGKGYPIYYINNRPIRNMTELEQLQSDNIAKIEVIYAPGAQYSPGTGAVIKIKTRRPAGEGFSSILATEDKLYHYFSTNNYIDLSFRTSQLELFATLWGSGGKSRVSSDFSQEIFGTSRYTQYLSQQLLNTSRSFTGKIGANYTISPGHSIGVYYSNGDNLTKRHGNRDGKIFSSETLTDDWDTSVAERSHSVPRHAGNIYYNGETGPLSIDFNTDMYMSGNYNNSQQNENSVHSSERTISTHASTRSNLWAEKLVIGLNAGRLRLDIGEEYTVSHVKTLFENPQDILSSSQHRISESNIAPFIQLSAPIGNLNLTAGIRYEHIRYSYRRDNEENEYRHYDNFFPSVSASIPVGNVSLSLNYDHRTIRPSYAQLDGNLTYLNRITYQCGNPNLKSMQLQNIDLMGHWRDFYAKLSFQHRHKPTFFSTRTYDDDPTVKLITFDNFANLSTLDFIVGGDPMLTQWWYLDFSLGISNPWLKIPYRDGHRDMTHANFMVQVGNYFILPHGFQISLGLYYQSGGSHQNCNLSSSSSVDFSIYRSFFNKRLDVRLGIYDIFDQSSTQHIKMYSREIFTDTSEFAESRHLKLSIRYKLNIARSRYKGTGAGNNEKNRFEQ